MPQNITKIEDYIGFTQIPVADVETFFSQFAFDIEKRILRGDGIYDYGLLGDHVYIALMADLDSSNDPQTAPYTDLIDGINYTGSNGKTVIFCGIKKMLTYFVYSEFIKNNRLTNFQAGTVKMTYEHADLADVKYVNHLAHQRWNEGVSLYNGEVYDYLLFYQSSFTNWDFTKQGNYITIGII